MKVEDLISELSKMPRGADVEYIYDGFCRVETACVWLTKDGRVILSGGGEPIYYQADRPDYAPREDQEPNWRTPPSPSDWPRL